MEQWTGPVVAALIAAVGSFSLSRGGAEARLRRRASEHLQLAGQVRHRSTRQALHQAAVEDIARALELRKTGRASWWLGGSAVVVTAIAVAIPPFVAGANQLRADWQGTVWLVVFFVYLVLAVALWAAFARVVSVRMKVLDDGARPGR